MSNLHTYTNGFRIEVAVSHRYENFVTRMNFPNYKKAREYCDNLKPYYSLLNGFTIRRIARNADGSESTAAVLMHRRFVPLEQCIEGKPVARPKDEAFLRAALNTAMIQPNPFYNRKKRRF